MLIKIYSGIMQAFEVLRILIYSFWAWGASFWLNFWITAKAETVVTLNGIKMAIRTKNAFTKSADISMAYECIVRDDYQLKHLNIGGGSLVIDIGGHIGSFSLAAAKKFPDAKILCFEPSPGNYAILTKSIRLNKFSNIKPYNKAVSSIEGEIFMYLNQINSAANSIYNRNGICVKAPSTTLERIFKDNHIKKCAFMKMDCEGSEYDILLNTPYSLLKKINAMIIEYHSPGIFGIENKEYNLSNLLSHLQKAGFRCTLKKMKHYQGVLICRR